MEEDRAQVDLGIAADIEHSQPAAPVQKQPKKRFVGRRAAAAKSGIVESTTEDAGAIQGESSPFRITHSLSIFTLTTYDSLPSKASATAHEPGPT